MAWIDDYVKENPWASRYSPEEIYKFEAAQMGVHPKQLAVATGFASGNIADDGKWEWEGAKSNYASGLGEIGGLMRRGLDKTGVGQYMGEHSAENYAHRMKSQADFERSMSSAPQSWDEMQFGDSNGKGFLPYVRQGAMGSAPYLIEAAVTAPLLGATSIARGAAGLGVRTLGERAAVSAYGKAMAGATPQMIANGTAHEVATRMAMEASEQAIRTGARGVGIMAGTYPSSVGDILGNQHDEAGTYNDAAALGLGVPYAGLNLLGAEGLVGGLKSFARSGVEDILTRKLGRGLMAAGETMGGEAFNETGQEVMNQFGRMAVNPNATLTSGDALQRYKESAIMGGLIGGGFGAGHIASSTLRAPIDPTGNIKADLLATQDAYMSPLLEQAGWENEVRAQRQQNDSANVHFNPVNAASNDLRIQQQMLNPGYNPVDTDFNELLINEQMDKDSRMAGILGGQSAARDANDFNDLRRSEEIDLAHRRQQIPEQSARRQEFELARQKLEARRAYEERMAWEQQQQSNQSAGVRQQIAQAKQGNVAFEDQQQADAAVRNPPVIQNALQAALAAKLGGAKNLNDLTLAQNSEQTVAPETPEAALQRKANAAQAAKTALPTVQEKAQPGKPVPVEHTKESIVGAITAGKRRLDLILKGGVKSRSQVAMSLKRGIATLEDQQRKMRDKEILYAKLGWDAEGHQSNPILTHEETAAKFGITKGRVTQVLTKAGWTKEKLSALQADGTALAETRAVGEIGDLQNTDNPEDVNTGMSIIPASKLNSENIIDDAKTAADDKLAAGTVGAAQILQETGNVVDPKSKAAVSAGKKVLAKKSSAETETVETEQDRQIAAKREAEAKANAEKGISATLAHPYAVTAAADWNEFKSDTAPAFKELTRAEQAEWIERDLEAAEEDDHLAAIDAAAKDFERSLDGTRAPVRNTGAGSRSRIAKSAEKVAGPADQNRPSPALESAYAASWNSIAAERGLPVWTELTESQRYHLTSAGTDLTAQESAVNAVVKDVGTGGTAFSRSSGTGTTASKVQATVDGTKKRWANAPRIVVLDTPPSWAVPDARGAFHQGTVYLFASNLNGKTDTVFTLFHEALGHYGLRGFFGKGLDAQLRTIAVINKNVRDAANKWASANKDIQSQHGLSDADMYLKGVEEALADLAGTGKTFNGLRKLMNWIQSALRTAGFTEIADRMENWTDAEALSVLSHAKEYVAGAQDQSLVSKLATAFSRISVSDSRGELHDAIENPDRSQVENLLRKTDMVRVFIDERGTITHAFDSRQLIHREVARSLGWATLTGDNPYHTNDYYSDDYGNKFYPLHVKQGQNGLERLLTYRKEAPVAVAHGEFSNERFVAPPGSYTPFSRASSFDNNPTPEGFFAKLGVHFDELLANPVGFFKSHGLGWLTLEQMVDVVKSAAVRKYTDVMVAMQKTSKERIALAANIDQDWAKLSKSQQEQLSRVMREATRAQFDPSDASATPQNDQEKLVKQFYAPLDGATKEIYKRVRDYYAENLKIRKEIMLDAANKAKLAGKNVDEVHKLFAAMRGPYFPLMRLGKWYSVGMSEEVSKLKDKAADGTISQDEEKLLDKLMKDEKHYKVQGHASRREAMVASKTLENQYAVSEFNTSELKTSGMLRDMPNMAVLEAHITDGLPGVTKSQVTDLLSQMYFDLLPEGHALKRQMKRKGIYGEEQDMRRVFAQSTVSQAHYISRLKHSTDMSEALVAVQNDAKNDRKNSETKRMVYNELKKRSELAMEMDESPIVDRLLQGSYFAHLGLSPAFLITNMTQVPMIAAPWLGARHGFPTSGRALAAAYGDTLAMIRSTYAKDSTGKRDWRSELDWKSHLKGDEADLFQTLLDRNLLDITMEHDLTAVAEMKNSKLDDVIKMANLPVRVTELANRSVVGLAAYRLAKAKPGTTHAQAVEHAAKAISETQLNYSALNSARHMQSVLGSKQIARLMFQFRKYQQGMIYLVAKNVFDAVKGGTAEEKRIARRTLLGLFGTTGLMAGAVGLPFAGSVMAIASALGGLGGDDDEPFDAEVEFRNFLSDVLGQGAAAAVAKGLPTLIGMDLSKRIGMGDIGSPLPFARQGKTGTEKVSNTLAAAAGAAVGTIATTLDGMQALMQGDFAKGAEKVVPLKAAQNMIKAYRYETQGLTNTKGELVLPSEKFSAWDIALRGAGFQPMKEAEYYASNAAVEGAKQAVSTTRTNLLRDYAQAKMAGEPTTDIEKEMTGFNSRHPEKGPRIDVSSKIKAVQTRRKMAQERNDAGVRIDKWAKSVEKYGRFAAVG